MRVNDYAGLLAPQDRDRLEQVLADRERATGTQMAIAIFPSLQGGSLEDFSIRLADRWRVGQKGLDNGVILVVFVQDRKLRFEIGYGLEPVIPDAVAGQIIREAIAPRFREGRYAAGLEAGIAEIYAHLKEGPAGAAQRRRPSGPPWRGLAFLGLMVVIAIMLASEAFGARRVVPRRGYTATRGGWQPTVLPGPYWGSGRGFGGGGSSGGGDFSAGGGGFGGGGASGDW